MQIGNYTLQNNLILAPMAGISDRPFRELCKKQGAGLAVSEMVASNPALRYHKRTLLKADHTGESGIRSVQILGTDPQQMAEAARFNDRRIKQPDQRFLKYANDCFAAFYLHSGVKELRHD